MVTAVSDHDVNKFDYTFCPVNDLQVVTKEDAKSGKQVVQHVLVQDEPIKPTQRFWTSLYSKYGISNSIFKYFNHAEVFNRISQTEPNDRLRICIERGQTATGKAKNRLMAVSNPKNPLVVYDELIDMLGRYNGQHINYVDGKVESTHTPRMGGEARFDVMGDVFENRFIMSTPIDGYGMPNIYLSLLRMVCQNGMIGYAKAFRSQLALGKSSDDVTPTITRALDGFNSDDGYAAIRQRIDVASRSWCSVYESQQLYKLLVKMHAAGSLDVNDQSLVKGTEIAGLLASDAKKRMMGEDTIGSPIIKAFHRMTGDPCEHYGLANLDSLSVKRQQTLPVDCKMYDMINFATEVATHYATPTGGREVQAWVGNRISEEYDMENTTDKFTEFADFLIDSKLESGLTGSSAKKLAETN